LHQPQRNFQKTTSKWALSAEEYSKLGPLPDFKTEKVLTTREQALGPEKVEIELKYWEKPEINGPLRAAFGTLDDPVPVPSFFEYRLVACQGGNGIDHDMLWHRVKATLPTVCIECGQAFKLQPLGDEPSEFMGASLQAQGHDNHSHGHEESHGYHDKKEDSHGKKDDSHGKKDDSHGKDAHGKKEDSHGHH